MTEFIFFSTGKLGYNVLQPFFNKGFSEVCVSYQCLEGRRVGFLFSVGIDSKSSYTAYHI